VRNYRVSSLLYVPRSTCLSHRLIRSQTEEILTDRRQVSERDGEQSTRLGQRSCDLWKHNN